MKFPSFRKKKVESKQLNEPLLSPTDDATEDDTFSYDLSVKGAGPSEDQTVFPPRPARRSAMVRAEARRKSLAMDAIDLYNFNRMFTDEESSVGSDYISFSAGRSIDSTDITMKTDNVRGLPFMNLPSVEEEEEYDDSSVEDYSKGHITAIAMIKLVTVYLLAAASMASYVDAFVYAYLEESSIVSLVTLGVAGCMSIVLAPFVCVREWRLSKEPGVRSAINQLRGEARLLEKQVQILRVEVVELRAEAERMGKQHDELHIHAAQQGISSKKVVDLVKENKAILSQMQEYLRDAVLQNVIKEILRCDLDRNGMLNKKETAVLATSLQISLGAYGIVFDVEKFHRAIGLSPSLISAVTIVKRLIPDKDNKLSSFYSTMSDSVSKSVRSEAEEHESLFDMFYMPVRRAFEDKLTETMELFFVKENVGGPKYMLLEAPRSNSMPRRTSSGGFLEGVIACPECQECPYCIAKPKKEYTAGNLPQVRCARMHVVDHA